MSDRPRPDPPSAFVARWAAALSRAIPPPRRALDVAMGRGRHSETLAAAGFEVFGVDNRSDAVRDAVRTARARGSVVHGWVADLTHAGLPRECFELVLVARYLQRDLLPAIKAAAVPGGFIVYETFTVRQRELGRPPRSPEHLLEPGELRSYFEDCELLFYEEVVGGDAVARLVARRFSASNRSGGRVTAPGATGP
jgi:SAM-dependent methyltransferase